MVVIEHLFLPTAVVEYLHYQWCFSFGGLGIGIFTFISGYLIARSLDTRSIKTYAASRFWRIVPTYLFVLALAWGVFSVFGYSRLVPGAEATPTGILAQAFLVRDLFNLYNPLVSSDWTLIYEVQFYVLIAFAWAAYQRLGKVNALIAFYIGLTLVGYALLSLLSLKYGHGEAAVQRTGGALFCFTGSIYYLGRQGHIQNPLKVLVGVWALGAVCYTYFYGTFFYGYLQVSLTHIYAVLLAIFVISKNSVRPTRVIAGFAAISFPVYLLHQTFGTVGFSRIVGTEWDLNVMADRAITFALIIVPASIAIHLLIERRFMWPRRVDVRARATLA